MLHAISGNVICGLALLLWAWSLAAAAQYPGAPIRVVIPDPPGSGVEWGGAY